MAKWHGGGMNLVQYRLGENVMLARRRSIS